jgi:hypothetical protein
MLTSNSVVHYDTNLTVGISTDSGVTAQGTHGRFAAFSDTRTLPLVPDTSKYTLSLIRGAITTDNFPLFVPLLRPSTTTYPNPVTENNASYWETTMQPGLALTWTGPVYAQGVQGVVDAADQALASWPTYGYLPFYAPNLAAYTSTFNSQPFALNLGAISTNPDCTAAVLASRIQAAFTTFNGGTANLTVAVSGRYLSFTNGFSVPIYFDFSLPSNAQQSNMNPSLPQPMSKQGILQACKLLGFIPGQVATLSPGVAFITPRPFQLAFRTTLNLYTYKNVRWTPEDSSVAQPSSQEVASGYVGTYFDCYTYQHLLNQCVNPTFQRLIFDEYDGNNGTPYIDQCLQRQLYNACYANCRAILPWSVSTSYTAGPGTSVVYKGRAYYPQTANTNVCPVLSPTTNTVNPAWVDCGPSILNSWVVGVVYNIGDVVTYNTGSSAIVYYSCKAATSGAELPTNTTFWNAAVTFSGGSSTTQVAQNNPQIGTLSPTIAYNPTTSLFVLNLDSYGFGGTQASNAYDGYAGVVDDTLFPASVFQQPLNAALNDQARDSWGLTGTTISTPAYTTFRHPGVVFDERMVIEADDYFNQLFGNWPTLRLTYVDPRTSIVTSYVRYGPQAANAGLAVPAPLPLVNPTIANTGYLPITRVAGNQPYFYTFPQDYPSVGLMWNPIDTIVITSGDIPVLDDQVLPPVIIGDNGVAVGSIENPTYNPVVIPPTSGFYPPNYVPGQLTFLVGNGGGGQSTNASTLRIIGEFIVKSGSMQTGQEYRNQIIFEPQTVIPMDLQRGIKFNKFSYQAWMRMKSTQILRPVTLSNGGSLNMRWRFDRKY